MTPLIADRSPACCTIEHSEAVEDYLKAVYELTARADTVTTTAVASCLGVSAPSASAMLKRLAAHDLVAPGRAVALTAHGARHAERVVRRHRLLETLLVQVVGVPWDEVHDEAEVLEHALSDRLEERIDALLGHPDRDPHGDPIPPRDGAHHETWGQPLDTAEPGDVFVVERVRDRDADALRYLADRGVLPGAVLEVDERTPFGGPLWVRVDAARHPLPTTLTRLVHGRTR